MRPEANVPPFCLPFLLAVQPSQALRGEDLLRWAVTITVAGVNLQTVGLLLFIVGILGVVLSLAFWNSWGGFQPTHTRRPPRTSNGSRSA